MLGNFHWKEKGVLRTTVSMTLTCKINGVQSGINGEGGVAQLNQLLNSSSSSIFGDDVHRGK